MRSAPACTLGLATACLLFAVFSAGAAPAPSEQDKLFISVLQGIADYSAPGMGVDEGTWLPIDHVRIDPDSNRTYGRGLYTAASKIGPYLLFLLKVYQAEGYYGDISLLAARQEVDGLAKLNLPVNNQTVALLRLYRALRSIREVVREEEPNSGLHIGGMVAWLSIARDGKAIRDKDLVPLLDNGLLSWSYAALIGALEHDEHPLAKPVRERARELLGLQQYELFLNREDQSFFGEIDVETGLGNPALTLKYMWSEDMLAVLWGLLSVPLPDEDRWKIWDKLEAPLAAWQRPGGEAIDAPVGYIGSNHELVWTLFMLPVADLPLKQIFFNSQVAQADYAVRRRNPGFLGVAYDALGAHMKMGVPGLAQFPGYIQRDDCSVVFATAPALVVDEAAGRSWLSALIGRHHLLTAYGPLESVGPEGRADVLSADSQYAVALALGGGVGREVKQFLAGHSVPQSQSTNGLELVEALLGRTERAVLEKHRLAGIRAPAGPFPQIPDRKYPPEEIAYEPQAPVFEVLENLAESGDDRHGAHVFSPEGRYMRWDAGPGGMLVSHSIPKDAGPDLRFAWWGTYLGKRRPYLAGYTDVEVTLPNDSQPHKFLLLMKREDTALVKPIVVDTSEGQGLVSADAAWITYTYPLKHRRRFLRLPFTYLALSIEDPQKNKGFLFDDTVRVKSIRLVHRAAGAGPVDVRKAIADLHPLPAYVPHPPRRPVMEGSTQPEFLGSGGIGEATEGISQEEQGVLYFEFEHVNPQTGYAGIWTEIEEIDLSAYAYLVFDVVEGLMPVAPNLLRVEGKHKQGESESAVFAWNVNLATPGMRITRDRWRRIIVPVPQTMAGKKINMLSFVYETWVGRQENGSVEISSPVFAQRITALSKEEEESTIRLSPELKPGESLSLLACWQVQKMDHAAALNPRVDADTRQVTISGSGGWMGAKLYPSMMASALGDELQLTLLPLTDDPCGGYVEFKNGPLALLKTTTFRVPGGPTQQVVKLPLAFRSPTQQADYLVMAGIQGHYRILDLRVVRLVREESTESAPGAP